MNCGGYIPSADVSLLIVVDDDVDDPGLEDMHYEVEHFTRGDSNSPWAERSRRLHELREIVRGRGLRLLYAGIGEEYGEIIVRIQP